MKILSLTINGFGCFTNTQFDFKEGLNTLCRPNGYGKSTLAAFIKVMFYGLDSTAKSVRDNEYELYAPRSGGTFGGSLVFEQDGKQLRIERSFTSRAKSGSAFALFDNTTNKPCNDYGSNIGEMLFGIDAQGFMRSVFFPQREVTRGTNDSITARLTSLIEQGEGEASVDCALGVLDEHRRQLRLKKGAGGELFSLEKKLRLLRSQCELSHESIQQVSLCKEQIELCKARIAAQNDTLASITARIPNAMLTAQYQQAQQELLASQQEREQTNARLSAITAQFGGVIPQQQKAEELRFLQHSVEELRDKKDNYTKQYSTAKPSSNKSFSPFIYILFALTVAFAVAGILTLSVNATVAVVCFVLGGAALLGAVLCVVRNKQTTSGDGAQLALVREELAEKTNSLRNELAQVNASDVMQFSLAAQEYDRLSNNLSLVNVRISQLAAQINVATPSDKDDMSVEALTAQQTHLIEEKSIAERQLVALENQLAAQLIQAEQLPLLQVEIEQVEEEYNTKTLQFESIMYAMQYLTEAREQLRASLLPSMQKSFAYYINMLGAQGNYMLDSELKVRYLLCGSTVGEEYMSEGYADLTDFCCRLALSDALTDSNGLLILDDCFVNLDDDYMPVALKLLKELSKRYQIIYLTCHSSRMP